MRRVVSSNFIESDLPKAANFKKKPKALLIAAGVGIVTVLSSIVAFATEESNLEVFLKYNKPAQRPARQYQAPQARPVPHYYSGYTRQAAPEPSQRLPRYLLEQAVSPSARVYETPRPRVVKVAPKKRIAPKAVEQDDDDREVTSWSEHGLPYQTSYCVRTCDGGFFPLGQVSSDLKSHEDSCNRLCPDAATALYVAPAGTRGIEDAKNRAGAGYEDLPMSYAFKTKKDAACTCLSAQTRSAMNYSVLKDRTMARGDIVMANDGLRELNASAQTTLVAQNFSRVDMQALGKEERKVLVEMESASTKGLNPSRLSRVMQDRIAAQINYVEKQMGLTRRVLQTGDAMPRTKSGSRYVGPDRL